MAEYNPSPDRVRKADSPRHPGAAAAEYGHLHIIDYLLGAGQLDINMQVTEYLDLFVLAALNGREETALGLLDRGYAIDCDFRFPKGRTLREVAEEDGQTMLVTRMDAICR